MNKSIDFHDIASENYYDFVLNQMIPHFDRIHISGIQFRLHLKTQYGKQDPNNRQLIREHIVFEYDKYLKFREKKSILDLAVIPQSLAHYFSISHTQNLGGYLASNFPMGLDLEVACRVETKTLQRVCSEKEISQFQNFSSIDSQTLNTMLWSAKEACFKALHIAKTEEQPTPTPTVLSDITIKFEEVLSFNETPVLTFSCDYKNVELLKANKGFAIQIANHICTIFFL